MTHITFEKLCVFQDRNPLQSLTLRKSTPPMKKKYHYIVYAFYIIHRIIMFPLSFQEQWNLQENNRECNTQQKSKHNRKSHQYYIPTLAVEGGKGERCSSLHSKSPSWRFAEILHHVMCTVIKPHSFAFRTGLLLTACFQQAFSPRQWKHQARASPP